MDTPTSPTPLPLAQPTPPDPVELEERVDSLQRLVGTILVLLLIVSGTLSIFLYWQVRTYNRELQAGRQQLSQIQGQQNEVVRRMQDFGRTHPDFVPILAKYGLKPESATGAPPAGSTPLAVPPKK
jgi:hypothetical protein